MDESILFDYSIVIRTVVGSTLVSAWASIVATLPSAGEKTLMNIFMASKVARGSFFLTESPTFTSMETNFPAIGALTGVLKIVLPPFRWNFKTKDLKFI